MILVRRRNAEKSKKRPKESNGTAKGGLTTLGKKLSFSKIYRRFVAKYYSNHIRELTAGWHTNDILGLISEYKLNLALKKISDVADSARPLAPTASADLLKLRKIEFMCDLDICHYENLKSSKLSKVHLALFEQRTGLYLSQKSSKDLDVDSRDIALNKATELTFTFKSNPNSLCLNFPLHLPTNHVQGWVDYIYGKSSNMCHQDQIHSNVVSAKCKETCQGQFAQSTSPCDGGLFKMCDENFRTSMKNLWLDSQNSSDVVLTFTFGAQNSDLQFQNHFCCHGFILAARSTFFHSVLSKYVEKEKYAKDTVRKSISVQLDSEVFSPRYVQIVLNAMYLDEVKLQLLVRSIACPANASDQFRTLSDDALDLMEILCLGRLLGFPRLTQACEDQLLQQMNNHNVVDMLHWSSQPCGSDWLRRQAVCYIRNYFHQLCSSNILMSLSCDVLCEIIESDFLNASEIDVLKVVLKWGELELWRKLEKGKRPNLVQDYVAVEHSLEKLRAIPPSWRDVLLSCESQEIRDRTSSLMKHVRFNQVLPTDHEVLASCIRRGIVVRPPTGLFDASLPNSSASQRNHDPAFWIRERSGASFKPPRLFHAHIEEAKVLLQERMRQDSAKQGSSKGDSAQNGDSQTSAQFPDALYMVGDDHREKQPQDLSTSFRLRDVDVTSMATKRLKFVDGVFPVPSPSIGTLLLARERSLRQTVWLKQVLQMCRKASPLKPCDCFSEQRNPRFSDIRCPLCRAEQLIRILVVREHGLPDLASDLLRRHHLYYDPDDLACSSNSPLDPGRSGDLLASSPAPTPGSAPKRLKKLFQKRTFPRRSSTIAAANLDLSLTLDEDTSPAVINDNKIGDQSSSSDGSLIEVTSLSKIPHDSSGSTSSSCVPDVAAAAHFSLPRPEACDLGPTTSDLAQGCARTVDQRCAGFRSASPSYSQYLRTNRVATPPTTHKFDLVTSSRSPGPLCSTPDSSRTSTHAPNMTTVRSRFASLPSNICSAKETSL